MLNNLQKIGGIAALIEAFACAVGVALYFIFLDSSGYAEPVQKSGFSRAAPVDHAHRKPVYLCGLRYRVGRPPTPTAPLFRMKRLRGTPR